MAKKSVFLVLISILLLLAFVACENSVDDVFDPESPVTGVSLNRESTKIPTGSEKTLVATVFPVDVADKRVNWSSSNTSVAKVDANGKVTAVNPGSATITVKTVSGGKTASCNVTVKANARNIPLTLEFPEAGHVTLTKEGNPGTVLYSLDGGATKTAAPFDTPIEVPADGRISFYRTLDNNLSQHNYFTINCDEDCYVYGNVMSLIDSENFATETEVFECSFFELFYGNEFITSHPTKDLILPAETLADHCYAYMFLSCTALEDAPTILATTLADDCCISMFNDCSNLKMAPDLLATTAVSYCFHYMFSDCTSLEEAPELPATTLADSCYDSMFENCTSLKKAPALPATTMVEDCYLNMFAGCTSLTSAPELPSTSLFYHCYYGMFDGCTSLKEAPILPATTLAEGCYSEMFSGCTSLEEAPILPATTLTEDCYAEMFSGCTSLSLITCLATDISAQDCTYNWVENVASTGTFTKAPTADWS
ncbi:MAG: Ig domain-containing protein, partial [Spirochaetales bacterium]|nr:Ig domain-containing protein [Spirochaetales bacterium]